MKKHILIALTAFALQAVTFAQAKKAAEPTPPAAKTEAPKPEPKKADAKSDRPMPMNSRVDEIDAAAKTFTQVTRDGKRVKHVITKDTEIKQGTSSAKFEEIKVGDTVAGSRIKKTEDGTEYEVVKITKFGAKPKADAPKDKK
jgi:hypothetical protein